MIEDFILSHLLIVVELVFVFLSKCWMDYLEVNMSDEEINNSQAEH